MLRAVADTVVLAVKILLALTNIQAAGALSSLARIVDRTGVAIVARTPVSDWRATTFPGFRVADTNAAWSV